MKKLRMFDSLKFVVAVVVATLILNVAHADTNAIQSVIAYGKTEQSATPTPTNPVPIMTNNGVLKLGKNLFNENTITRGYFYNDSGVYTSNSSTYTSNKIPINPGTAVTFSRASTGMGVYLRIHAFDSNDNWISMIAKSDTTASLSVTGTAPNNTAYIRVCGGKLANADEIDRKVQLEKGSTATAYEPYGIYADGMVETIRDVAGHTATAQMLLSVGDYKDEQNINTGAITRKVGVKVFDGTENWGISEMYSGTYRTFWLYPDNIGAVSVSAGTKATVISNYFSAAPISGANNSTQRDNTISTNSSAHSPNSTWIRTNDFSTVSEFKSWLAERYAAGTPVIVVYPLATETTENVTTQSLTTAPVRQTAGSILGMPIEVVLGDGTREWVRDMITIATTRYNEEQFEPVQNRLSDAMDAVDDVVTRTMTQAQQIDQIANEKQTRPDEGCTAKYCLLVEDEDGTPHWYPIAGANGVEYVLPSGYTQLEYIQSDGASYLIVPYRVNNKTVFYARYNETQKGTSAASAVFGVTSNPDVSKANYGILRLLNGTSNFNRMGWGNNVSGSVIDVNAPQNLNTWYEVLYDQNKLYQDNVLYATSATPNDTEWVANYDLGIFARNSATVTMPAIAKISSVWAKEDGVYKINLVPAKNSSGVVGMYDLVSGQFFTNQGTGEFGEGPVVE